MNWLFLSQRVIFFHWFFMENDLPLHLIEKTWTIGQLITATNTGMHKPGNESGPEMTKEMGNLPGSMPAGKRVSRGTKTN